MKFKTTWILFAVLAAIAAYFFLVEEKRRKADERERLQSRIMLPYEASEVERIVLFNPMGDRIEMKRTDTGWSIIAPVRTNGAATTIELLLKQTVPGQILERITDVAHMADFGLAEPFATVILFPTGKPLPDTIHIGDKTPTSSRCYVRLGDSDTILVTRDMTYNVMNKSLYHLRDKFFIDLDTETVTDIHIKTGPEVIHLRKDGRYWWFTDQGVRADRMKIEPYLTRLSESLIQEFITEGTEDLGRYDLDDPERVLTISTPSDEYRIAFGNHPDHSIFVLRNGLDNVVVLTEDLSYIFDLGRRELRAENLCFFDPFGVHMIRYEWSGAEIVLEAAGNDWSFGGDESIVIRRYQIITLLRTLEALPFETILTEPLDEGDERLEEPLVRMDLFDEAGERIDRITIAEEDDSHYIGASLTANAIGRLRGETLTDLLRMLDSFAAAR
ncbi:MAG: DUF4340 domain-containing protein [bacterium]|nr:MAG: DUF4340 domain-containing protein [bacterium]